MDRSRKGKSEPTMMPPFLPTELKKRFAAAGEQLVHTPLSRDYLLPLLDQIEALLSKVHQSPAKSMQNALAPLMKALVMEHLLKNSDVDVNVGVASCISEIIRITAPGCPYDDDKMKNVFQLIVSSFENLSDVSSRSYEKRAIILETMAKVRSYVVILDLECYQMIIEMFQHFLKAISDDHANVIFASMERIMTDVLEECGDISPELLAPILATLKRNNEAAKRISKKLAEQVLQYSPDKLRPYLRQAVKSFDTSLDDYSEVVSCVCGENIDTVGHSSKSILNDQPVVEGNCTSGSSAQDPVAQAGKVGSEETNIQDEDPTAARSPKLTVSIGGIKETVNKEIMVNANSSKTADSKNQLDVNLKIRIEYDDGAVEKPVSSEDKPEFVESQQVLDNHKIPDMAWKAYVDLSDDDVGEGVLSEQQGASDIATTVVQASGPLPTSIALPPPSRAQEREVSTSKDKGKRIASSDLSLEPSKKSKPSISGSSEKGYEKHGRNQKGSVCKALNATLELPKSLMELGKDDCLTFLKSMPTVEDNNILSQNTDDQSKKAEAQLLVRFLALYGRHLNREGSAADKDLCSKLEAKDKELLKVSSDLNIATTEIAELKRQLKASEWSKRGLERRLESSEQCQRDLISQCQRREAAAREEGRNKGLVEGVEACRHRILLTSAGQTFLKELHEGLLDAYRQSTLYLADMGPHIAHFVKMGFKSASSQAREKGFTEKLNIKAALDGMTPSPAFKGDQSLPPSHTWWLPVMHQAVLKLAREDYISPELPAAKEPFYDLFSSEGPSLGDTYAHPPALPPISEIGTPDMMVQDSKEAQAAALCHEGAGIKLK